LYGELPSYGKLANLADDKAELTIKFRTNSDWYKVVRFVKNGKNSAYVYRNDAFTKPIVGPKVSEVNAFITKIVGPKELLLSSVFSTQVHAGDIVELEPSKRKDIFHKLLGLEVFAEMQDKVNDKFKESKTKREMFVNQLQIVKTLDEVEQEVIEQSTMMAQAQTALATHEGKIINYAIKLDESEAELKVLDGIIIAREHAVRDLVDNRTALIKTNEKLEKFSLIDVVEIDKELTFKNGDLLNMEAGFLLANKEYKELEKLTDAHHREVGFHEATKLATEHICDLHAAKVNELMDKIEALDNIGCSDDPLPCTYIDGAKQAEKELETCMDEHAETIKDWNKKNGECQKKIALTKDAKNEYHAKMNTFDRDAYETLKAEIQSLVCELDEAEMHNCKKDDLLQDVEFYLNGISASKVVLDAMESDTTEKFILVQNLIQGHKDSLGKERILATAKEVAIAEYKKDLTHLQEDLGKLTKLDAELKVLDEQIPKLDVLNEALSKNGIPQLIIDSALPQLQDILDILCGAINKFSIEINTQKPNKEGTNAKETIDFIVDDGIKPRDVKFYSGGEKKLLKTVIRLSLSLFQSQRTGNSYKLLLMDETFDALDFENSMMLLKIIYNLRTKFKQIFVISHSDDVLGRLSKCIKFKREGGRTLIDGA
jgi:DNA repair exonuclease SbcCD ATPase subunit